MKETKWVSTLILVVAVIFASSGCFKATGGGWFYNLNSEEPTENKITFGFNAQSVGEPYNCDATLYPIIGCDQDAKGEFQLVDHGTNTIMHGTFEGTFSFFLENEAINYTDVSEFLGTCTVNGEPGYSLDLYCHDAGEPGVNPGDEIEIRINNGVEFYVYYGVLGGGNIQVHP